jgi:hypothetical protein
MKWDACCLKDRQYTKSSQYEACPIFSGLGSLPVLKWLVAIGASRFDGDGVGFLREGVAVSPS